MPPLSFLNDSVYCLQIENPPARAGPRCGESLQRHHRMECARMQRHPSIYMAATELDAPRGILNRLRSAIPKVSLPLRRWYQNSALRLLFVEIRALGPRIQLTLRIREVDQHHGTEEVQKWMDECLVGGPCTREYILYMQQIEARTSLTIVDSLIATHAWKSGWVSGALYRTSQNQADTV